MMIDTSTAQHATTFPADRPADAGRAATERAPRAIPSANLLLGQSSVTIDHDGTHYVLRATRAGKLILTK
jgi:hemin uptake protein HemP